MTNSDATLTKVRKLLTLAENPAATPAEAAAFTAKAAELMANYGIDQAMLAGRSTERNATGDTVIRFAAPYARDKCSLAAGIAQAMRCKVVVLGGDLSLSVHLFGLESDLVCVEILTTSLLIQGTRELARTPAPRHENLAAYRRSWWAGFSAAIRHRLAEAEAESIRAASVRQSTSVTSVALVLADRSDEAVAAMNTAYPRLKTAARRRLSGGGSGDGYTSGQQADLGTTTTIGRTNTHELIG